MTEKDFTTINSIGQETSRNKGQMRSSQDQPTDDLERDQKGAQRLGGIPLNVEKETLGAPNQQKGSNNSNRGSFTKN